MENANASATTPSPTKANSSDVKGDKNDNTATTKEVNNSMTPIDSQVSSSRLPYIIITDDIKLPSLNVSCEFSAPSKIDPIVSQLNISPRGTGDCSGEDLITFGKNARQEKSNDEEDINLFIVISSQINAYTVVFSKGKQKKGITRMRLIQL